MVVVVVVAKAFWSMIHAKWFIVLINFFTGRCYLWSNNHARESSRLLFAAMKSVCFFLFLRLFLSRMSGFHNHASWLSWGTFGFCDVWLAMPSQTIATLGFSMCAAFFVSLLYSSILEIYCSLSKWLLMFLSTLFLLVFPSLLSQTCNVSHVITFCSKEHEFCLFLRRTLVLFTAEPCSQKENFVKFYPWYDMINDDKFSKWYIILGLCERDWFTIEWNLSEFFNDSDFIKVSTQNGCQEWSLSLRKM